MLKFTGHFPQREADPTSASADGPRSRVLIDMGKGLVATFFQQESGFSSTDENVLRYNVFDADSPKKAVKSANITLPSVTAVADATASSTFGGSLMPYVSAPLGNGRTVVIFAYFSGQGSMVGIVTSSGDSLSLAQPIMLLDKGDLIHNGSIAEGWAGYNGFGYPFGEDIDFASFDFGDYAIIPTSAASFDIVIPANDFNQVAMRSYTVGSSGAITPVGRWRFVLAGGGESSASGVVGYPMHVPLPGRKVFTFNASPTSQWMGVTDVAAGTFVNKKATSLSDYRVGGLPVLTTRGEIQMAVRKKDDYGVSGMGVATISIPSMKVSIQSFASLGIGDKEMKGLGAYSPGTWSPDGSTECGVMPTRPLPGALWSVGSSVWAPGTTDETAAPVALEMVTGMIHFGGAAVSSGHKTTSSWDDPWGEGSTSVMAGLHSFMVTDTHVLNWRHYEPDSVSVACWRYKGEGNLKPGAASRKGYFS